MTSAAITDLWGPGSDCANEASFVGDMADFAQPRYSRKQVVKAGKLLREPIPWDPARYEEYSELFKIVWDWRNSHAYPAKKVRQELAAKIRRVKATGLTAARTKRLKSIRRKLAKQPWTLVQMQDIGGCRAILNSMEDVHALVAHYRNVGSTYETFADYSHIEEPTELGYRSHHFVVIFAGSGEEAIFNNRRIEIQIRTRLQHAWATTVEGVGMVRREELKAGEGHPDWLRLFQLVSSEFADREGCPLIPNSPEKEARYYEIRALERKLDAANYLEKLQKSFQIVDEYATRSDQYFMITFDHRAGTIEVRSFNKSFSGTDRYSQSERVEGNATTTVLVEVDKLESLIEAYPNYFFDSTLFVKNLRNIIRRHPVETLLSEAERPKAAPTTVKRGPDLSWLKDWGKRR